MRSPMCNIIVCVYLLCTLVAGCLGATTTCPTGFSLVGTVCTKNFDWEPNLLWNNWTNGFKMGYGHQASFIAFPNHIQSANADLLERWAYGGTLTSTPLIGGTYPSSKTYPTKYFLAHPHDSYRATLQFKPTETTCKTYQISYALWKGDTGTDTITYFTQNGVVKSQYRVTASTTVKPALTTFCTIMQPNDLFDMSVDKNIDTSYDSTYWYLQLNATCAPTCANLACEQSGKCALGGYGCDNNGNCTVSRCFNGYLEDATGQCICYSGWSGDVCNTTASPQCVQITPNQTATSAHPVFNQEKTGFANSSLVVVINGTYVKSRTYKSVTVERATNAKCNFTMNSFWSQDFVGCRDEFTMKMPWANWNVCGFNETITSDRKLYRAVIWVEYSDSLGIFENADGLAVSRTVKQQYDVYVSLPRTLTVSVAAVNVSSTVDITFALSNERYDASSKKLSIELTSIVGYPHMLRTDVNVTSSPAYVVTDNVITVNNTLCTAGVGSVCVQKLGLKLALTSEEVCTFSGAYRVSATLTSCREANTNCTTTSVAVSFTLASDSVCARVNLQDVVTGDMKPYPTSVFTDASLGSYKYGAAVYFYVNAKAASRSDITLKFLDITLDAGSGSGSMYLMKDGSVQGNGTLATLVPVDSANYFSLFITARVFNNPAGTYVLTAKCQITYLGNKRSLNEQSEEIFTSTRIHVLSQRVADTHVNTHKTPYKQTSITNTNSNAKTGAAYTFTHVVAVAGAVSAVFLVALVVALFFKFKGMQRAQ